MGKRRRLLEIELRYIRTLCFEFFRLERFEGERDELFEMRQDVPQAEGLDIPREARLRSETQDSQPRRCISLQRQFGLRSVRQDL